ncbi:MAG TPA: hypothetical protein PLL17_09100 [Defluviitaleaceae bacterium]|nr:hypothetical protein [Candidatus Epulonipiscium sp.]HOQ15972.1 hypothetical protein [Defluviitaleaceae bacterium]HQD51267.1 hypothetical protein [Defluviitaleaceae bacterium]
MVQMDELKVKLREYGIMCYETIKKDGFPTIYMPDNDLESFLDFVMNNQIKNFFKSSDIM